MPRQSVFSNLMVEIPNGCYVDKKRLYVYYRKNSVRRQYKDRPGTYPDHDRVCVGKAIPPEPGSEFRLMVPNANCPEVLFGILKKAGSTDAEAAAAVSAKFGISFTPPENRSACGSPGRELLIREENAYLDHVSLGLLAGVDAISKDSGLLDDLVSAFGEEDAFLILDLAQYMLGARSAVFQRFPHWAKTHALFTHGIPSAGQICDFLSDLSQSNINRFKKLWARRSMYGGRMSLCCDSADAGSQAEGVMLIEEQISEEDPSPDQMNTEYVIRHEDGIPVTYSEYVGSLNDLREARKMVRFLGGIAEDTDGTRAEQVLPKPDMDIIFDRGTVSDQNVQDLDAAGVGFLLLLRRNTGIAEEILMENIGRVRRPDFYVSEYDIYARTVEGKLFEDDPKVRHFHIIWDQMLETAHRKRLYSEVDRMETDLKSCIERKSELTEDELKIYRRYFTLTLQTTESSAVEKQNRGKGCRCGDTYIITEALRNNDTILMYDRMCGEYVLVSSEPMSAVEAYEKYHRRDSAEEVYSAFKSQLGMDEDDVLSDDAAPGKTLVWFVASVLYTLIQNKTAHLKEESPMSFSASRVLDCLDELEADLDPGSFRYELRYSPTRNQQLVFDSLGIKPENIKAVLRKIEYTRPRQ